MMNYVDGEYICNDHHIMWADYDSMLFGKVSGHHPISLISLVAYNQHNMVIHII